MSASAGRRSEKALELQEPIDRWFYVPLVRALLIGLFISSSTLTALAQPGTDVSRAPVIKLALGDARSCALHKDGQVSCWGKGQAGLPGADAVMWSAVPTFIRGIAGAVQVAAGDTQACARTQKGQILCWGEHRGRQPVLIEGVSDPVDLTSECARLRDGSVQCWGQKQKAAPLSSLVSPPEVTAIATDEDRGCMVVKDGGVLCWSGLFAPRREKGLAGVVEVGLGDDFACARHRDGTVSCWGENGHGQLGRATIDSPSALARTRRVLYPQIRKYPPARIAGLVNVVALSVGSRHACAKKKNDTLSCWGQKEDKDAPEPVPGIAAVRDFAAGRDHACAIKRDGTIACWGESGYGQLGMGWGHAQPLPTVVPGVADVTRLQTDDDSTCAIRRNGSVICWGHGVATPRDVKGISGAVQLSGSVGLCARDHQGRVRCRERSVAPFTDISLPRVTTVGANSGYACAVVEGGRVWCWGNNQYGVFGTGIRKLSQAAPAPVMPSITDAVGLCAASFSSCVLRASGEVACTGRLNESDGPSPDLPRTVEGVSQATSLACDLFAACVIRKDSQVMCWQRSQGQDERNKSVLTPSTTPSLVPGLSQVVQLSMDKTACVRRFGGDVACWGRNSSGQVGDGTIGGVRSQPVKVLNIEGAIDLSSSDTHGCAAFANGSVKCWGQTSKGQVGTYATDSWIPPVEVRGVRGETL